LTSLAKIPAFFCHFGSISIIQTQRACNGTEHLQNQPSFWSDDRDFLQAGSARVQGSFRGIGMRQKERVTVRLINGKVCCSQIAETNRNIESIPKIAMLLYDIMYVFAIYNPCTASWILHLSNLPNLPMMLPKLCYV
jgi:hypothetical protein